MSCELIMISRDALRYLRSVNRNQNQRQLSQYVCPFCTSRAISTTSASPRKSIRAHRDPSERLNRSSRSYASASSTRRQPLLESTPSTTDDLSTFDVGKLPLSNGNVREYLGQWTQERKEQDDQLGNQPMVNSRSVTPNSLFIRDVSALEGMREEGINAALDDGLDHIIYDGLEEQGGLVTRNVVLNPGDCFIVRAPRLSSQIAMHLGYIGLQHQLLLQNGKWMQGMITNDFGQVIHNFATPQEIENIKKLLPTAPINAEQSADLNGLTAFGELPSSIGKAFSTKFRRLQNEYDAFRRNYSGAVDQLYEQVADQLDYKELNLSAVTRQYMGFELDSAPGGARIALFNKLSSDSRYAIVKAGWDHTVVITPKNIADSGKIVASWARDYQDAAARASAGNDVLPDLRKNPLTNFIAKARRLISKSRKIRTFDEHLVPGLTSPACLPTGNQQVERRPTGETFSEHDKQIIKLIWDTCVRRPRPLPRASTVLASTIALVLRAVGAYPNRVLDNKIAKLFLQELGCMEPWVDAASLMPIAKLPWLGVNHDLKVVQQREEKALKDLNLDLLDGSHDISLPDTMATVRKDWTDLEAFAVDPITTRVKDDAFSVEPSTENPVDTWIHIHTAHPSAYIPPHHEILSRPEYMGQGYYGRGTGSTPYLPFELLEKLSISDQRPSSVMTVSTLLGPDGSVKDVTISVGTLRNTISIDRSIYTQTFSPTDDSADSSHITLIAGTKPPLAEPEKSIADQAEEAQKKKIHQAEQARLIEQHRSKFELLHSLLKARFEARKRENPNHLRLLREPARQVEMEISTAGEPDRSFDRLFRSEHCYGDPFIKLFRPTSADASPTYADYPEYWGPLYQLRSLALESLGSWAHEREVPVMWNVAQTAPDFPLERLNTLTRYDRYRFPISGPSLKPGPHVLLNLRQSLSAVTPLRKFTDLINQYQISAYLQAQGGEDSQIPLGSVKPEYPYSEADLERFLQQGVNTVLMRIEKDLTRHWTSHAFYRAWVKQEAGFPKYFDARVQGDLNVIRHIKQESLRLAYLQPWGIRAFLEPSEQGYESSAKPTQYLPVKIISYDANLHDVHLMAIGPATDHLNFPDNFVSPAEP